MDSINYQYHKFAGYVLYPVRLFSYLSVSTVVVMGNVFLDKLHLNSEKLFQKTSLIYSNICTKIFGLNIYVENRNLLSDKPCLIISNHINLYDHYVMAEIQKKVPAYLANSKYNFFPFSLFLRYTKSILCYKDKKTGVVQQMKQYVNQRRDQITLYPDACDEIPEDKLIAPFYSGAFATKLPIQPIVLRYISSSNTNMNWNDNTLFSILNSYLMDGDIRCYAKVLPVQYYKGSYKSHENYKQEIYNLMDKELKSLPEKKICISVDKPSTEFTMNILLMVLGGGFFSSLLGWYYISEKLFLHFIVSYFCHFYPTRNTKDLDTLVVSTNILWNSFDSIEGSYDLLIRFLFCMVMCRKGYIWFKRGYSEIDHIVNLWIPMYAFAFYLTFIRSFPIDTNFMFGL